VVKAKSVGLFAAGVATGFLGLAILISLELRSVFQPQARRFDDYG